MIPTMAFGRTGHDSTRLIFGAAALGGMKQAKADATIEMVRNAGVNHFDTAASYGDSELRLADFLQDHRQDIFLATKTGDRDGDSARRSIENSLTRMQIDQVDLIQFHNLARDDEWETAMGPGGALEAAIAAQEEGLVRFIGVTGHGTRIAEMHLKSLDAFDFASVLLPYNYLMMQEDRYREEFETLYARCPVGCTISGQPQANCDAIGAQFMDRPGTDHYDLDKLESGFVHTLFELLIAVPVAVGFFRYDAAFQKQAFEYQLNIKHRVACIANANRYVFEIAKQGQVTVFGHDIGGS